ncbi:MAG: hypothetical protein HON43_03510 [Alphaproteobacteria bacterium]|nr:hypothetical protein [Alphaproteobacteria bacterium]MBT5389907.1 hypothetical protein [Alphaproteobacteria bacterium]
MSLISIQNVSAVHQGEGSTGEVPTDEAPQSSRSFSVTLPQASELIFSREEIIGNVNRIIRGIEEEDTSNYFCIEADFEASTGFGFAGNVNRPTSLVNMSPNLFRASTDGNYVLDLETLWSRAILTHVKAHKLTLTATNLTLGEAGEDLHVDFPIGHSATIDLTYRIIREDDDGNEVQFTLPLRSRSRLNSRHSVDGVTHYNKIVLADGSRFVKVASPEQVKLFNGSGDEIFSTNSDATSVNYDVSGVQGPMKIEFTDLSE